MTSIWKISQRGAYSEDKYWFYSILDFEKFRDNSYKKEIIRHQNLTLLACPCGHHRSEPSLTRSGGRLFPTPLCCLSYPPFGAAPADQMWWFTCTVRGSSTSSVGCATSTVCPISIKYWGWRSSRRKLMLSLRRWGILSNDMMKMVNLTNNGSDASKSQSRLN